MTTELKKIEIANQFLTGLRTRDWDLLKSVMANDLVWNLPGSVLFQGKHKVSILLFSGHNSS
jgi:uncharacterized protein